MPPHPDTPKSSATKQLPHAANAKVLRIAVVEDDGFIRESVAAQINARPEFELVASCSNGEEALQVLPPVMPDVVLVDINLPGMKGTECVRKLKALHPRMHFLMLTVYEDSREVFDALLAGASGYLLKRTRQTELLNAIGEVHQGGSPMSGHIARKVVQYFNQMGEQSRDVERLSKREAEVLELLAKGTTYKEIASILGLSLETIRMNVKHIYAKLHVHSRGEAVAKFVRR